LGWLLFGWGLVSALGSLRCLRRVCLDLTLSCVGRCCPGLVVDVLVGFPCLARRVSGQQSEALLTGEPHAG